MTFTCYLYLNTLRSVVFQDSHVLGSVQMQNEKIVCAPDTCVSFIVSFTGIDFSLTMG